MGGLFGKKQSSSVTVLNGIQLNSSQYGTPIALLYGRTRVTPTLIWYGDFKATKVSDGGGGKGGGGSGGTSYVYAAAIMLSICEGPLTSITTVFADKTQTSSPNLDLTLFSGAPGQTVWPFLTQHHPTEAIPYANTAYVANSSYQLGSSAALPNLTFEATGLIPYVVPSAIQTATYTANIGSANPHTVTVVPPAGSTWVGSLSVTNANNQPFTEIFSSSGDSVTPASGQYIINGNGVYTFAAINGGNLVHIQYEYETAPGVPDAEPSAILTDYLSDPLHGACFPYLNPANGANGVTYKTYCLAMGFFLSPYENSQRAASDFVTEILEITNSVAFDSPGRGLTFVPYAELPVTGNGVTYTPDTTPEFDFTDEDFLNDGDGMPVVLTRKPTTERFNKVNVEFLNRNYQYNTDIAPAFDQNDIDLNGDRVMSNLTYHEIQSASVARMVAQLRLQRQLFVINTYQFKVLPIYGLLECMDYVTITDANLGLIRQLVRIIAIEDDANDEITITAEQVDIGTAHAPIYNWSDAQGYAANYGIDPGPVSAPVIFSAPPLLVDSATGGYELWISVAGVNPEWGGCNIYLSYDNVTYKRAGMQTGPARYGALSADLPAVSDPDTASTLAVTMLDAEMQLTGGTQADADNMRTLIWVGGEIMSFETATLTGVNQYALNYLRRGQYGSTPLDHPVGTNFVRLDDKIFKVPFDGGMLGQTLYLKFTSFNIVGGGEESLADVVAYTKVLAAADFNEGGSAVYAIASAPAIVLASDSNGNVSDFSQANGFLRVFAGNTDVTEQATLYVPGNLVTGAYASATGVTTAPCPDADPLGGHNAIRLSATADGNYYAFEPPDAVSGSTQYTFSIYFKCPNQSALYIGMDVQNQIAAVLGIQAVLASSVWQRFSMTVTTQPGDTAAYVQIGNGVTDGFGNGSVMDFFGPQFEYGPTVGNYGPPSGPVNCAADFNMVDNVPVPAEVKGFYRVTAASADSASLTLRAVYNGTTYDTKIAITKARAGVQGAQGNPGVGSSGAPALSMTLTNDSAQVFAYADGEVPSYANINGYAHVLLGSVDENASTAYSVSGVNCTGTINTAQDTPVVGQPIGYYAITGMSAGSATLTITGAYSGTSISKTFSLTKTFTGYEIVSALPSTFLFDGRQVFNTTDGKLYLYDTSLGAWKPAVNANDLTGQLTAAQIASIAAAQLTGQITSTQISNGAVSTPQLAAGSVTTAVLAAGSVVASTIATNTITAAQMAAGTITANELAANSVTTNQLSAGAVTAAKIAVTTLDALSANVGTLSAGTIQNTGGTTKFDITNGIITFNNGTYMRVVGEGFGSTNQFLDWYGPTMAIGSCTEAAAIWYLRTDGHSAFKGLTTSGLIHTYLTGSGITNGIEIVPPGASSCKIEIWGGGGAGATKSTGASVGGGGGGAYSTLTITVAPGDKFMFMQPGGFAGPAYVGPGGTGGNNGGTATVSGSVTGGSVNMSAGGGAGGNLTSGGVGGTATGGSTNVTGGTGAYGASGGGANGGGANGAAGGSNAGGGYLAYTPGGGGAGDNTGASGGSAAPGQVQFTYS